MQAALPMGSNKITGMADPTVSTDGATKNYVDTTTAAFFSTGDIKLTLKTVADTGWLIFNDGFFGSVSSGAGSADNGLQALFTLFFNNLTDAAAPLLTSGGGATTRAAQTNAATAWAANCRMALPKMLGRALGMAGAGSGLTSRPLGTSLGEETHLLTAGELPTITSANASQNISVAAAGGRTVPSANAGIGINNINASLSLGSGQSVPYMSAIAGGTWQGETSLVGSNSISVTSNNTGGGAHNNMQPTVFLNAMVKW